MKRNALDTLNVNGFNDDLITWYSENKRDLPWRENMSPYKTWVSEIMLQQTQVDTVIPYFENFMAQFPTVEALADADEQDVLKAWEGLGYYSRARNLHHAVKEVKAEYGGHVPNDPKKLGDLKGIGPYTKGAILSIAFNQREPAVDGNVMRVMSRVLQIEKDIKKNETKKEVGHYLQDIIPERDPASFNQGLMELGALICKPKNPDCENCPVKEHCLAYKNNLQEILPIKGKTKKQKHIPYYVFVIKNEKNEYVIEKRINTKLLQNLWQFPMVSARDLAWDDIESWFQAEYGIAIDIKSKLQTLKHTFSHIIWDLTVFEAETKANTVSDERLRLEGRTDLVEYPFPVPHQLIFKKQLSSFDW